MQYRDEDLTLKEETTYEKIDSLGKKYKMDRNIKLLRIVRSGMKLPAGVFDVDLKRFFRYNKYEGIRLGAGGRTNYKFSQDVFLEGFFGYGFKDGSWKYGGKIDWFVNKPNSGRIFVEYENNVRVAGRELGILEDDYIEYLDDLLNYQNRLFYRSKRVSLSYEQDILENLTFRVSAMHTRRNSLFDYSYRGGPLNEKLKDFDTQLALRWAPREKTVRTPFGKEVIEKGFPVFYFTVTSGWEGLGDEYSPTRLDFTYRDRFRTPLGRTQLLINSGISLGETLIMKLYEGRGQGSDSDVILKFSLAGHNAFETMLPGEFFSDKYISLELKQTFFGFKFLGKNIFPLFIYRSLIGEIDHPEYHDFIDLPALKTPKNYYQEAGIEVNELLLKMIGVGAYYRFGNYSTGEFSRDFFVKFTLNLSLF